MAGPGEGQWSEWCLLPICAPSTLGASSPAWAAATASSRSPCSSHSLPICPSSCSGESSSGHTTALLPALPWLPAALRTMCRPPWLWQPAVALPPSPPAPSTATCCILVSLVCLWLQVLCAFLAAGLLLVLFPLPGALFPTSSPDTYSSLTSLC